MNDRFSLEGRVALITGGGTGIGRSAALVLAEHGADVVLAGRRPDPLESTAKEIDVMGRRSLAVPTDVTSADGCRQLVETTCGSSGGSTSSSTVLVERTLSRSGSGPTMNSIRSWR